MLYDMLVDTSHPQVLEVYLNIELDTSIDFYTKEFPVIIHSPLKSPNLNDSFVFGVSGPKNKRALFSFFSQNAGINKTNYANVIHPSAVIFPSSRIDHGGIIDSLVSVSYQSDIGFGVDIKRGAQIGHHNRIGAFCDINPGAILCGNVTLGDHCYIGAGSIIKERVTIGENTIIGLGSVVTKDIPEGVVAYGNPCKVVKDNPFLDQLL